MGQQRILWGLLVLCSACETRPILSASGTRQNALTTVSLRALIEKTPRVAHVKVLSAEGRAGTMGVQKTEAIFTELSLQVLAPIHGGADSFVITTLGGRLGERAMHVSDEVVLAPGDEAIVFVDPSITLHPFVGGQTGVLWVREGRVHSFDGKPLLEVRSEGFVFGRAPGAPAPAPALQPHGSAKTTPVLPPEGTALTVAEVLAALKVLP